MDRLINTYTFLFHYSVRVKIFYLSLDNFAFNDLFLKKAVSHLQFYDVSCLLDEDKFKNKIEVTPAVYQLYLHIIYWIVLWQNVVSSVA